MRAISSITDSAKLEKLSLPVFANCTMASSMPVKASLNSDFDWLATSAALCK